MPVEPIRCKLTTNDIAILETILDRLPDPSNPLAVLLRSKLTFADIYLSGAIPPNVVAINSRVTYRVNGSDPYTVVIVQAELLSEGVPHALSIHDPLGLALLGLSEGATAAVVSDSGWPRSIVVEEVVSQSEYSYREPVAVSRVISFPTPTSWDRLDGDDPGPTAA